MRILVVLTLLIAPWTAQARSIEGDWLATSKTAQSITGNVNLSPTSLTMTGDVTLHLILVSKSDSFLTILGKAEVSIFSVSPPKNAILRMGNTLCRAPVKWVVAWPLPDDQLGIAMFSDDTKPQSEPTSGECGDFFYTKVRSFRALQS